MVFGLFILNAFLFCLVLGLNIAVGFTPFTVACVVFTGIMTLYSLVMVIKS